MPKLEQPLDSRIEIATPENIAFSYVLAGPFRRLPAFVIDVAIRAVVLLGLFFACTALFAIGAGGVGISISLVVWFALSWFYGGFFETVWNGQTPGKRLMRLRVLTIDGQPINALQAVLRNVLRDADAMPIVGFVPLYVLGLLVMAANDRYQRLGDLACGTMVVVERRSALAGITPMNEPEVIAFAAELPPDFVPSRAMARALSTYVARRRRFSGARRYEIARTLAEPLTERLGLPADTNPDLLLCALYFRKFIADRPAVETGNHLVAEGGIAMKVAQLLEQRRAQWRDLETLCGELERRSPRRLGGAAISRFAVLYRSACADLALADAYQIPPDTVGYLHALVGRAHNQLYRSQTFDFRDWGHEMFVELPRRLLRDRTLWLAFAVFWGVFAMSMWLGYASRPYAEQVIGDMALSQLEENFSGALRGRDANTDTAMMGFYVFNNAGIGLRCFAAGLLLGIGGLFVTVSNAVQLGAVFGHMLTVPQRDNFLQFVTAHGPFELTAIVFSSAGMRLGFSLISTGGLPRLVALRRAAVEAMPTAGAAVVLFTLAALIEGFVSPSGLPYAAKTLLALLCTALLVFYLVGLGARRGG